MGRPADGAVRRRGGGVHHHPVQPPALPAVREGAGRRPAGPDAADEPPDRQAPHPPLDPDNEEFVLFIRAKDVGTKWLPLTVVTGGSSANNLVKATQGSLATDVFKNQLIRSIGEVVYRDQAKVEKMIRSSKVPGLGAVKEFEYGFKVRDKKDPEAWMDDTDVTLIPPKDSLPTTPLNTIAEGVRGLADKLGFGPKPAGAPGAK
eukprot:TRINITY_DN16194_c0_g1_i1.p2 TRINITY_DN16194_c0_g1~~TRINITY_DN16194_c0_g1_i1.p2  ORF type:complete len:237 (+),score=76.59 TRINITY_DN16194_c0_g1_i1:101-712(+)